MDSGLRLENMQVTRFGRPLAGLNVTVRPGEVLTVMGPSGVGKSTLLAAIMGQLEPQFAMTGRVVLNGEDITAKPAHLRGVGILFQDDLLFPHLSVGQNLAFGLRSRKNRTELIENGLISVDLEGMANRDPATLSGGQRARVALLRTLLAAPKALLLDEPFGRLDQGLRAQIRHLVFSHARQAALPVLLVTHDPADAEAAGGRVITLAPVAE